MSKKDDKPPVFMRYQERECRRDGCTETRFSTIGMELHLIKDHEPLEVVER